jgi:hypothetical protein
MPGICVTRDRPIRFAAEMRRFGQAIQLGDVTMPEDLDAAENVDASLANSHNIENSSSIWQESYAQCFQEKRHYDIMSWSLGAGMLAYASFIVDKIFESDPNMMIVRLAYAMSIIPFFLIWVWIYERNRVWGEICNEVARDIERRFAVDGVQLRYMRAHLSRRVMRTNSDLAPQMQELPGHLVPGDEKPFKLLVPSMHFALYILAFIVLLFPMVIALNGATSIEASPPKEAQGQARFAPRIGETSTQSTIPNRKSAKATMTSATPPL